SPGTRSPHGQRRPHTSGRIRGGALQDCRGNRQTRSTVSQSSNDHAPEGVAGPYLHPCRNSEGTSCLTTKYVSTHTRRIFHTKRSWSIRSPKWPTTTSQ